MATTLDIESKQSFCAVIKEIREKNKICYVGAESWPMHGKFQRETAAPITFPTGADFKDASSQALLWGDAETLIVRVLLFAGQDRAWWCEAVRWDPFHLDVFLKLHVDGPGE